MLKNKDPRLIYVLNGDAIENPHVADPNAQLRHLMNLYCQVKVGGGYKCSACNEEHNDLNGIQQHILGHGDFKLYLCVFCLKGANTLQEMKRHTVMHTGEVCMQRSLLKSPEASESPPSPISKTRERGSSEEDCVINHRCVICGFTSDRLDIVLAHAEYLHPTCRGVINELRLRLLRAAFDPKGYRYGGANEGESSFSYLEN
ncbi:unnamed protein product [Hydatigera taeniaeformis]|uniref:C2H2-type domain-containing protein n=1 Tax=Hydatigena taeniaeformis TaxID=6205 RepID=A0A0R3X6Z4_HYDTA|nr:unnamed protein product [Hydatigera taeniaeformis]